MVQIAQAFRRLILKKNETQTNPDFKTPEHNGETWLSRIRATSGFENTINKQILYLLSKLGRILEIFN